MYPLISLFIKFDDNKLKGSTGGDSHNLVPKKSRIFQFIVHIMNYLTSLNLNNHTVYLTL